MKRHNGLTLETTTGQPNAKSAILYFQDIKSSWGNQLHNLRGSTSALNDHLHTSANTPRTTAFKGQLAKVTIAFGLGDSLSNLIIHHDPSSLSRSGGIVAVGIAIGVNGYSKSLSRWFNRKNQLEQNQLEAKNELKSTLAFLGTDNFIKAALALETSETGLALNGLKPLSVLEDHLEKFSEAVEIVCKVALGSEDKDDLKMAIKGLNGASKILSDAISNLRRDIETLSKLVDMSVAESRYKRNADLVMPHLLKGYARICATRNDISNALNGILPLPKSADLSL